MKCMLSERVIQPELRKRLAAVGLDVDALYTCMGSAWRQRPTRRDAASEQDLLKKINAALADIT